MGKMRSGGAPEGGSRVSGFQESTVIRNIKGGESSVQRKVF